MFSLNFILFGSGVFGRGALLLEVCEEIAMFECLGVSRDFAGVDVVIGRSLHVLVSISVLAGVDVLGMGAGAVLVGVVEYWRCVDVGERHGMRLVSILSITNLAIVVGELERSPTDENECDLLIGRDLGFTGRKLGLGMALTRTAGGCRGSF
mgnify:CR=1 FL=1